MPPFPIPLSPNVTNENLEIDECIKQKVIDNEMFDGYILEEFIEETTHYNDRQLSQIGTKTEEKVDTIDTEIDCIDIHEFKETVLYESISSKIISRMNSDLTSNCKWKSPLTENCNKISTASNLTVLTKTRIRNNPCKCHICGNVLYSAFNLKRHKKIHNRRNSFKCNFCVKTFSTQYLLTEHTKLHISGKLYKCNTCDKVFSTSSSLTVHQRTHNMQKPYKCDKCNMGFCTSYNLMRHIRSHSGEKLYKCDICNKGFTRASNLTIHIMNTHTDKKSLLNVK